MRSSALAKKVRYSATIWRFEDGSDTFRWRLFTYSLGNGLQDVQITGLEMEDWQTFEPLRNALTNTSGHYVGAPISGSSWPLYLFSPLDAVNVDDKVFNDGGSHVINYSIETNVRVENSTTVTVAAGATINGVVTIASGSKVIVNGGHVQGEITGIETGYSFGNLEIHGGTVDKVFCKGCYENFYMTGGSVTRLEAHLGLGGKITGGAIQSMYLNEATFDISGGTFGSVYAGFESGIGISGGHFADSLEIGTRGLAGISGGTFSSPFILRTGEAQIIFVAL